MRGTLVACRSGLAVVAAVVLLAGCSGSDDKSAASSSKSASSTSASASRAGGADAKFCNAAASAFQEVQPAFSGGADPAALATALQQAADQVRTIDPPDRIKDDWTALADGIEQFAQAFAAVDPNDPASQTALQQRSSEIIGRLTASATKVQNYLTTECGLDVGATTSAAPSS